MAVREHDGRAEEPIEYPAGRRRLLRPEEKGSHSRRQWQAIVAKAGHRCLCCGVEGVKLTKDHIQPISRAGRHTIDNIQPLCAPCNTRKGARHIDYRSRWLRAYAERLAAGEEKPMARAIGNRARRTERKDRRRGRERTGEVGSV